MSSLQQKFAQLVAISNDTQQQLLHDVIDRLLIHTAGDQTYRFPLNALIGTTGETLADRGIVRVPNTPAIGNSLGYPHGGIIATIADGAMGRIATERASAHGKKVVTSNLNIHYLATTTADELIATGTIIKEGKSVIVTDCTVTDSTGRELAYATATFHVITPRTL
ncbi:MAG: PaaI family thioesterase [Caryophanon sp.]|nr:PaaI family thioesterase [Caryophanon sp.]